MRRSPEKHTLAKLRMILGLGQKEMGQLIGCSTSTIQKIELCKLPLKPDVAERIAMQTAVDLDWLKAEKPDVPANNNRKEPYKKEDFQRRQNAINRSAYPKPQKARSAAAGYVGVVLGLLAKGYRDKRFFKVVDAMKASLQLHCEEFGMDAGVEKAQEQVMKRELMKTNPDFQPIVDAFSKVITECQLTSTPPR